MKSTLVAPLAIAFSVACLLSAAPAEAQQAQHYSFRATGAFTLGVAGRGEIDATLLGIDGSVDGDLDPTIGMHLAGVFQLGRFFFVGAEFNHWAWRAENDDDRDHSIGLGVQIGGHYGIAVSRTFSIDPTLMFAVGYAAVLDGGGSDGEEAVHGYFFGIRGGATVWFMRNFGATFLMGYERLSAGDSGNNFEYDVTLGEFEMRFGASVRF